jgi:lipopolysaccharide/colanic/teichoic acid biosynthesis glycosyltransferase
VFFRQARVGRGFKIFIILKFRTMVSDAAQRGAELTSGADSRITRVGAVLRLFKIDELPQLVNVLRGEMGLVGPRPEVPRYVERFHADYQDILTTRPGITDLSSLKYRNEAAILGRVDQPEDYYISTILPDKIRLAKEYLRHHSLLFDVGLIVRTVGSIVLGERAFSGVLSATGSDASVGLSGMALTPVAQVPTHASRGPVPGSESSRARVAVRFLPSTLLLAAIVVYPLLWRAAPQEAVDTLGYQELAQRLVTGRIDHVSFRVPGFPVLLALTGSSQQLRPALFVVQLLLYVLALHLLLKTTADAGVKRPLVAIAALVLVSPPFIEHTAYALSESLTASLLIAGVWVLTRNAGGFSLGVLSGAVFGAAALTRPSYQLLMMALAPVAACFGWRRRAVGLLCGAGLVIGSYCAFNYANFGYFGTTPALGLNLTTRTVRVLERLPAGPLRETLIQARNEQLIHGASHTGVMYIWSMQPRLEAVTGLQGLALERFMLKMNLGLIAAAPLEYLSEVGRAVATYWLPAFTELSFGGSRPVQFVWTVLCLAVVVLFWLGVVAIGGTALTHGLRSRRSRPLQPVYALAVVIVLYTMAVSCLFEVGNPRYRVPSDAFVVCAAVLGLTMWRNERKAVLDEPRRGSPA